MAKQLNTDAANLALRAAAIVGVIYGIGFLLMPYFMLQLSGDPGAPTNSGWVRWAGGFVLGRGTSSNEIAFNGSARARSSSPRNGRTGVMSAMGH